MPRKSRDGDEFDRFRPAPAIEGALFDRLAQGHEARDGAERIGDFCAIHAAAIYQSSCARELDAPPPFPYRPATLDAGA